MRIKEIIGPTEKGKNAPKALCYCLSKKECREMAGRLNVLGIHAIAFTSDNNDDGTAPDILRSFLKPNDNTYSLLCCTTGRFIRNCRRCLHQTHVLTSFSTQYLVVDFIIPAFGLSSMHTFRIPYRITFKKRDEVDGMGMQLHVCFSTVIKIYR